MDAWETLTPLFRETTHNHMLRSFRDPESWDDAVMIENERASGHGLLCPVHQWTGSVGNASWLFTFPLEVIAWCGAHISWDSASHTDVSRLWRGTGNAVLWRGTGKCSPILGQWKCQVNSTMGDHLFPEWTFWRGKIIHFLSWHLLSFACLSFCLHHHNLEG